MGLKPECDPEMAEIPGEAKDDIPSWNIYPPPPPPRWHWKAAQDGVHPEPATLEDSNKRSAVYHRDVEVFNGEDCEIPGKDEGKTFEVNDEGVFTVYVDNVKAPAVCDGQSPVHQANGQISDADDKQPLSRVPRLKEYFTDLDFLLGVCSDGPAKSFAFRRLKYLQSKWSLYCLLNEYQELADMKAVPHR